MLYNIYSVVDSSQSIWFIRPAKVKDVSSCIDARGELKGCYATGNIQKVW